MSKYTWWIIGAVVLFLVWRYMQVKNGSTNGKKDGSTFGMSSQVSSA